MFGGFVQLKKLDSGDKNFASNSFINSLRAHKSYDVILDMDNYLQLNVGTS